MPLSAMNGSKRVILFFFQSVINMKLMTRWWMDIFGTFRNDWKIHYIATLGANNTPIHMSYVIAYLLSWKGCLILRLVLRGHLNNQCGLAFWWNRGGGWCWLKFWKKLNFVITIRYEILTFSLVKPFLKRVGEVYKILARSWNFSDFLY